MNKEKILISMKNLKVALVFFFLLLCCCSSHDIEKKIVGRINEACSASDSCTVHIRDLTDFSWDKMYVFKYTATPDDIKKVLGTSVPKYTEFTRKIIFLNDNKVVYIEEETTDIENVVNGEIIFDIPDNAIYSMYSPDSTFKAIKKNSNKGTYYELKQIQ